MAFEVKILPYRQGSKSARELAVAIGGRVLLLEGTKFRVRSKKDYAIINWGRTDYGPLEHIEVPEGATVVLLNKPALVREASNKLLFFNKMKEVNENLTPKFWTNPSDIPADAYPVVCRTVLAGHSGEGIVLADSAEQIVPASLYVQYRKKKDEFRIHVGRTGKDDVPFDIIASQRKARRIDTPDEQVNWKVRNHSNGFIYAREGFSVPLAVQRAAVDCLSASGLDFGAVDVIWNEEKEQAYVLEINCAPGLEGQTVTDYATFFST